MSNKQAKKHVHVNEQLSIGSFSHTTEKGRVKGTIANLSHVFEQYGIKCQYDEILKQQTIKFINSDSGQEPNDLSENSIYAQIQSILALNDMPSRTCELIPKLLEQAIVNPILDFIQSKPWDGIDRLPDFINTLVVSDTVNLRYRELAVKTWLVQCVAAADSGRKSPIANAIPKFELVLVLQGAQGAMKTTWFKSLLPSDYREYIVDGAHLDPADRDTVKRCISAWIVELGEIDSTFRKADIARLKAFLSNDFDNIRLPYARVDSKFKRRTSFGASVNPSVFLVDDTGSRRFLTLPVIQCLPNVTDMQQLWAQVWELYLNGNQWWCSKELDTLLAIQQKEHSEESPIGELIASVFNMEEPVKRKDPYYIFKHLSATEIVMECGINQPTKQNLRETRTFLEKHGFKCVQLKARGYWITTNRPII